MTELEELIADVISAVGGLRLPVDAVFFESGVTSVMLPAVHEEIRRRTGRDFPITAFFGHPTIRSLAAYLDRPLAAPEPLNDRPQGLAAARRNLRAQLMQRKG
ncbi:acyl carrier protein [Nonomuraea purpurea]|uniref:Acyl carrier protein n=1 Tax=Nonomuraea purpurea TaxID=1849276 RepID=A0ABV8GS22_9ACTN